MKLDPKMVNATAAKMFRAANPGEFWGDCVGKRRIEYLLLARWHLRQVEKVKGKVSG
jgi:hypothetical protein